MIKAELPKIFESYQHQLNTYTKLFYKDLNNELYLTHKYFLGWIDEKGKETDVSGKSFRPSLMMLINESLGGDSKNVLPLAMSIELFHNFSLIHDDIEDKDEIRRNRKTVWKIWGEEIGIISGSSMHALASKSLDLIEKKYNNKKIYFRKLINKICLAVIEGQYLDISFESNFNISVDNYTSMIEKKTGALIEASAIIGANIENTTKENILNFSKIGKLFGHMFQIKDDYLGIWGDHNLGKPVGSDIIKKKKSLPILKLIESSNMIDNKNIKMIFSSEILDDKSKEEILTYMKKYSIQQFCEEKLQNIYKECEKIIENLEIDTIHKNIFKKINYFLMYRDK
ncbi:MAG: polyprenyl synthetase family protein [Dehalococcoidia bacterium]|nr:polyprenyl synthetase family protein [Dehalococcoidia bacterium]